MSALEQPKPLGQIARASSFFDLYSSASTVPTPSAATPKPPSASEYAVRRVERESPSLKGGAETGFCSRFFGGIALTASTGAAFSQAAAASSSGGTVTEIASLAFAGTE